MTQEIYIEGIRKIMDNKKVLEKELGVKITNKGKNVFLDGEGDKEFIALKVLEALNLGFSLDTALLLKRILHEPTQASLSYILYTPACL